MIDNVLAFWRRMTQVGPQAKRYRLDPFEPLAPQPDRELDVFLDRLPVQDDTLETHLALAELFRARGQTDRAIRVHESMLEADLERSIRNRVRVELAQDYFSAGFLGHVETVLEEMILGDGEVYSAQAFRLWLTVLEREKEWGRAIQLVRKYGEPGSGNIRLANLYSEYANQLSSEGKVKEAREALKEARSIASSARIYIVSAELETSLGRYHKAMQLLKQALVQDVRRVDVVLPALRRLSSLTGGEAGLRRYLEHLYDEHPSHRVLEALLDFVGDNDPKAERWQQELENIVNAGASFGLMQRWLEEREDIGEAARQVLIESLQRLKVRLSDIYQCNHCGFESTTMLWFCPQCERWETSYSRHEQRTFVRQAEALSSKASAAAVGRSDDKP